MHHNPTLEIRHAQVQAERSATAASQTTRLLVYGRKPLTDYEPSALAEVSCDTADGCSTLVFVRDLRHPPEAVWAVLTQPEELRQWAPFTPDRDLAATGSAMLTMISASDGGPFEADVRRAEPYEHLEYTWGDDLLVWHLAPHNGGTRLTLRHTLADPSFLAIVAAGWHVCLDVAEGLLDGDPIGPIVAEEAMAYVAPLEVEYAVRLGTSTRG